MTKGPLGGPRPFVQSESCNLVIKVEVAQDMNASEEDTAEAEFNHILREDTKVSVEKFGSFITGRYTDGVYEISIDKGEASFGEIEVMKETIENTLRNMNFVPRLVTIEAREVTTLTDINLLGGE